MHLCQSDGSLWLLICSIPRPCIFSRSLSSLVFREPCLAARQRETAGEVPLKRMLCSPTPSEGASQSFDIHMGLRTALWFQFDRNNLPTPVMLTPRGSYRNRKGEKKRNRKGYVLSSLVSEFQTCRGPNEPLSSAMQLEADLSTALPPSLHLPTASPNLLPSRLPTLHFLFFTTPDCSFTQIEEQRGTPLHPSFL